MTRSAASGALLPLLFLAGLLPARESVPDRTAPEPASQEQGVLSIGDDTFISRRALENLGRVRLRPGRNGLDLSETGREPQPSER
jgi:hypothetical protein